MPGHIWRILSARPSGGDFQNHAEIKKHYIHRGLRPNVQGYRLLKIIVRVRTFGHAATSIFKRVRRYGVATKGFALLTKTRSYRRRCAAGLSKGFGLSRGSSEGFVLLGRSLPNFRKGSHFKQKIVKGSHFWPRVRWNLERVRTFGVDLQGVCSFGKGLQRVRTFGHGFAKYSKRFALLCRSWTEP